MPLETMLAKVADYYEKEVDNEIKAISTIIEPVMMVMMGIMAFTHRGRRPAADLRPGQPIGLHQ